MNSYEKERNNPNYIGKYFSEDDDKPEGLFEIYFNEVDELAETLSFKGDIITTAGKIDARGFINRRGKRAKESYDVSFKAYPKDQKQYEHEANKEFKIPHKEGDPNVYKGPYYERMDEESRVKIGNFVLCQYTEDICAKLYEISDASKIKEELKGKNKRSSPTKQF